MNSNPKSVEPTAYGDAVNQAYQLYATTRSVESRDALLVAAQTFALRFLHAHGFTNSLADEAEDTAQKVALILFEKLDSFYGKSKFSTWLHTVIRNAALMTARRQENRREDPLSDEQFAGRTSGKRITASGFTPDLEDDNFRDGKQDLIAPNELDAESQNVIKDIGWENALATLSNRERRICELLREGYEQKEIAKEVGLSVSQTNHVIRAMSKYGALINALCAVRVPRCGLKETTEQGIRRAYVEGDTRIQRTIEIAHEMAVQALKIREIPAAEYDAAEKAEDWGRSPFLYCGGASEVTCRSRGVEMDPESHSSFTDLTTEGEDTGLVIHHYAPRLKYVPKLRKPVIVIPKPKEKPVKVTHPKYPEFGIGVVKSETEGKTTVRFGSRIIVFPTNELEPKTSKRERQTRKTDGVVHHISEASPTTDASSIPVEPSSIENIPKTAA